MTQQPDIIGKSKENAIKGDSPSVSIIKEAFAGWLSDGHAKKYPSAVYLSCIDRVSAYLVSRKISIVDLWQLTKYELFKEIYTMAVNDKLFKATDKKLHAIFVQVGQAYFKFLRNKPSVHKTRNISREELSPPSSRLTIKEAIIRVMESEQHGMTIKEIYDKIIVEGLYSFGARNPQSVVRIEVDRACENSTYSIRASKNCFRFERNQKGEKVYFSLLATSTSKTDQATPVVESTLTETAYNTALTAMVVKVLSVHFPNGFRLDSPIELLRFRRFATEDFGKDVTLTDDELKQSMSISGTLFDGKVYVVSSDTEERIKAEVDNAFNDEAEIIFYEAFYEKHENWLLHKSVISVEFLRCILLKLYPRYKHRGKYFTNSAEGGTELVKIESEVIRVWGEDVLLNYERLAKRLPYIPREKLKYVLAYSGDFVWNSVGIYTQVNKIQISEKERAAIADFVAKGCGSNIYVSMSDIPLREIEERNYELTLTAIHNAVYSICLSEKYNKSGKIITRKGDSLDALTIMKDYCRTIDKCSLDDLMNYERELTGEVHRWIPMEAGYSVLVRIDKNSYVSERYVNFNINAIDNAIALFVTDDYLPLKSFTTFAVFPYCGQPWNLFLLESYCRRFSERFRFDTLSVNSRNAGTVICKNCGLTYLEVMAHAVAKSSVPYENKAVSKFLYESGYTGKSTTAKVTEIIELAKVIRERRN